MKKFKNKAASVLRRFAKDPKDFKAIPIFINNYNRLSTLKKLIAALENRGYYNIHILDNQSTFPPLLGFYKSTPHKVHFLKKNYGERAFWKSGLWLRFAHSYFAYTDSDVIPVQECPDDFMEYFFRLLKKYPKSHKVGHSLRINDLPNHFKNKDAVIAWEQKFYARTVEKNVYRAPIDTTFAFYRPFSKAGRKDINAFILRTGFPYQAQHLPWYLNSKNLDKEEQYYLDSLATSTHWSKQN